MYTEIMKQLLENKDKYKASQKKRMSFEEEWLSYVNENGLDEDALNSLCGGFEYRKSHPFVVYLKAQENKKEAVHAFFGSRAFNSNKPKSFKMALNLLTLLMIELPDESDLLAMVIGRLPSLSIGKDKNRNPEIGSIFGKYMISELQPETKLPDIDSFGLRPALEADLISMMHDGLKAFVEGEKEAENEKEVVKLLSSWFDDKTSVTSQTDEAETVDNINTSEIEGIQNDQPSSENSTDTEETERVEESISWRTNIKNIIGYIVNLENSIRYLQNEVKNKEDERERALKEVAIQRSLLTEKNKELKTLNEKCNELESNVLTKKKEIEVLQESLNAKEAEIADRIKLTEIISKDKTKQSDAVLQRLSSELSSYYEDFMSAQEIDVTAELGEVLRDQLADIYQILKKNGISL